MAESKHDNIHGRQDTSEMGGRRPDIHEERARLLRFAGAVLDVIKNFGGNQPTFLIALARNLGQQDASTIKAEITRSQEEIIRCAEEMEQAAGPGTNLQVNGNEKTFAQSAYPTKQRKSVYEFNGEEIGIINLSLRSKSKTGIYSGGDSSNEGANRYQRLLAAIDAQLTNQRGGEEIGVDTSYSIHLPWRKKRTLRGALRFVQTNQKLLTNRGVQHETDEFIRKRRRMPSKHAIHKRERSETEELFQKEKQHLAQVALKADDILAKLGYLNPRKNLALFSLE